MLYTLKCFDNVRSFVLYVCYFYSVSFLFYSVQFSVHLSFELNTCASFIFFDYFFWWQRSPFSLLLKLLPLLWCFCTSDFVSLLLFSFFFMLACLLLLPSSLIVHYTACCTCCVPFKLVDSMLQKPSELFTFAVRFIFPSTLASYASSCWCIAFSFSYFCPHLLYPLLIRCVRISAPPTKTPAEMECFWFCVHFARWFCFCSLILFFCSFIVVVWKCWWFSRALLLPKCVLSLAWKGQRWRENESKLRRNLLDWIFRQDVNLVWTSIKIYAIKMNDPLSKAHITATNPTRKSIITNDVQWHLCNF